MILRTQWRAIAVLFLFSGLVYGAWAVRIPALAEKHQLGTAALGVLLLTLSLGAIVSFPIAGRLADRRGAVGVSKQLVWFCPVAMIAVGFAPNVWALAVALFAFGAAIGALDVTMNAWAAEYEKRQATSCMLAFHAMWSLGGALGAGVGFVAILAGLSVALHLLILAISATAITVYIVAPNWPETPVSKAQTTGFVWPKGILLGLGFACMCATIGEGAMADWSTLYLIRINGASEAYAVIGFAVYSTVMIVLRLLGDRMIGAFGAQKLAIFSGVTAFVGASLIATSGSFLMTCLGFVFLAFGYAMVVPMAMSAAAAVNPDQQAGNIAAVAIFAYGGTLIGPPVLGFVAALTNLRVSFAVLAILALFLLTLARVFSPRAN